MRSKKRIKPFLDLIREIWEESPDLRFGQLLINLGLVEDTIRTWNSELIDCGIDIKYARGIFTWGTRGRNGKGEYKEIYLKDLKKDHLTQIFNTQKHIKGTNMEKYLREEIKFRKKLK